MSSITSIAFFPTVGNHLRVNLLPGSRLNAEKNGGCSVQSYKLDVPAKYRVISYRASSVTVDCTS
ncbi:hypothetical protein AcW1_009508 [Taiwanofungus camphoratus]|nr:hypothetical protein AcW1_009508 [Antrodia cinnamomea]